jgi:hypothetical protein
MSTYRLKGASGAVINQAFPLAKRTVIGSAAECEIRIESDGVAPQHAEILEEQDSLLLKNLATTDRTLLNGEAIDKASLVSGDEIRIANCRWVLQAPGLRPDRILTGDAIRARRSYLPWLIVAGLLAAAGLAWQQGLLPF